MFNVKRFIDSPATIYEDFIGCKIQCEKRIDRYIETKKAEKERHEKVMAAAAERICAAGDDITSAEITKEMINNG